MTTTTDTLGKVRVHVETIHGPLDSEGDYAVSQTDVTTCTTPAELRAALDRLAAKAGEEGGGGMKPWSIRCGACGSVDANPTPGNWFCRTCGRFPSWPVIVFPPPECKWCGLTPVAGTDECDAVCTLARARAKDESLRKQADAWLRAVSVWGAMAAAQSQGVKVTQDIVDALSFYADPMTYFAIGFVSDPPCGDLEHDFSETYLGPKPGKRARIALGETE